MHQHPLLVLLWEPVPKSLHHPSVTTLITWSSMQKQMRPWLLIIFSRFPNTAQDQGWLIVVVVWKPPRTQLCETLHICPTSVSSHHSYGLYSAQSEHPDIIYGISFLLFQFAYKHSWEFRSLLCGCRPGMSAGRQQWVLAFRSFLPHVLRSSTLSNLWTHL